MRTRGFRAITNRGVVLWWRSGATYSVETSSLRLKQDEHSLVASAAKAKFKSDKQQAVTDSKKSAAAKTAKSGAAKPSAAAAASDRKQPQSASAKAAAAAATAAMEDSDSDSEAVTSEQKRNAGGAILNEPCPECGEFEVTFHTMQLRSADEGQTVFKKCNNCDWQEKENS